MSKDTKQLQRVATSLETLAGGSVRNTGHDDRRERLPLRARLILWFGSLGGGESSTQMRRTWPIMAYVGPNGGGKTLCMIKDTLPTMAGVEWDCENPAHEHFKRGITHGVRRILSTVKLLDGEGNPHPLYDEFHDFDQLLEAEHCDVLMDEVLGVASSRESGRMDVRVQNILVQLRRRDLALRWSAPNWARADKIIREVTQAVTECRGYFEGKPIVRTGAGVSGALWAPKRVFRFRTYDTMDFEDWSAGKRDKLEPVKSGNEWFNGVDSVAFRSYDTLDAVTQVSHASAADICEVCDGRKVRKQCRCGERRASGRTPSHTDIVASTNR